MQNMKVLLILGQKFLLIRSFLGLSQLKFNATNYKVPVLCIFYDLFLFVCAKDLIFLSTCK